MDGQSSACHPLQAHLVLESPLPFRLILYWIRLPVARPIRGTIMARTWLSTPVPSSDRYEVVAPAGAGRMGEVYRARDARLNREVAVKVLPTEFSRDPDRLHRFQQEAQAVASLNHPNIMAIHDFGEHERSPYIVAELLEGETLRERLRGGALPPPRHSERLGLPRKKGSPPSAPASPRQSVCVCLVAPSFRLCLRSSLCEEPGLHRDPRSPQNCRSTVEKCVPRKISPHRGCVAIIQILGGTLGSVRLSRRSSFNFVRGSCGQLKF
jgi:hypothetical protein